MKYKMLLWPHANARYQNESLKLAENELRLMLDVLAPEAVISQYPALNLPALQIDLEGEMPQILIEAVQQHSLLYGLFAICENGAFMPVCGRAETYVGSDLAGIVHQDAAVGQIRTGHGLYVSILDKQHSNTPSFCICFIYTTYPSQKQVSFYGWRKQKERQGLSFDR